MIHKEPKPPLHKVVEAKPAGGWGFWANDYFFYFGPYTSKEIAEDHLKHYLAELRKIK